MKSRFMQELSGDLGDYWKKHAEEELKQVKQDYLTGEITIDESGVARNCIGRALMSDMLEKLALVTSYVDVEATLAVREEEVNAAVAEYTRNYKGPFKEELAEMRSEFGSNQKIVNLLTGQTICL